MKQPSTGGCSFKPYTPPLPTLSGGNGEGNQEIKKNNCWRVEVGMTAQLLLSSSSRFMTYHSEDNRVFNITTSVYQADLDQGQEEGKEGAFFFATITKAAVF